MRQPHPNPLRKEGLMGRVAPFAGVTLLALALQPVSSQDTDPTLFFAALLLTLVIITSPWYVPWERLPFSLQAIPPIAYYLVIALLRESQGGAASGCAPLVVLPVIWLALYGTRAELSVAIAAVGAVFVVPFLVLGGSGYPDSELTRTLLWVAISLIIGFTTQRLVTEVRRQAAHSAGQVEVQRHSEERLRRILETAHEAFVSMDEDGVIRDWNLQAEETFGWLRQEVVGRKLAATIVPEPYREAHMRGLEHFLHTGEAPVLDQRLELSALRRDGSEFPVELTISPLQTSDGYVFNAFMRDISERQQAEEALRDSQEKLQAILDNSTAVMYVKDRDYRYILVNREFERLFDLSFEEIVGKTDEHILAPEVIEELRANDRRVLEQGQILRQEEIVPIDGEPRTYVSSKFPLLSPDGKPYAICGISTDITERKRAEDYFRAQHHVTEVLAQASAFEDVMPAVLEALGQSLNWDVGAFWSVDQKARLLRCEQVWHGPSLDLDEFEALSRELTFAHGEGLPGQVWQTARPAWIADILEDRNLPRARTVLRHGLRSAIALPIESGTRFLGVLEFYTRQRKALDQDLVEMLGSLSGQLGQFIERHRAEQEAERIKSEFFSLVSHEFRTPLTSIVGYVDLLTESDAALTDEDRDRFLDVIRRNSQRLRRLVDDLLFISKVQAGRFSLRSKAVDLHELVHQALEAARLSAEKNRIRLQLKSNGLPPVHGDPDRLAQLFDNLISNAVKYTPERELVEVRLSTEAECAVAEVTNTGVYIPSDELVHLFERFFRRTSAGASDAPGVGLGLAIAESIVEAHGGRIGVESTRETGTTFRVELPLGEALAEADPQTRKEMAA